MGGAAGSAAAGASSALATGAVRLSRRTSDLVAQGASNCVENSSRALTSTPLTPLGLSTTSAFAYGHALEYATGGTLPSEIQSVLTAGAALGAVYEAGRYGVATIN